MNKFGEADFYHSNLLKKKVRSLRAKGDSIRVVIGAGPTSYKRWLSTDLPVLDALKLEDWNYIFPKGSVDRILAEHLVEHWRKGEFRLFLRIVRAFLSEQGFIRIAVPDGFHPDSSYIDYVKLGGKGSGANDHKVLYNYTTITQTLSEEGYDYHLLEYFDEVGQFHRTAWKTNDGFIERSANYDSRNKKHPLSYTSLMIDVWPRGNKYG